MSRDNDSANPNDICYFFALSDLPSVIKQNIIKEILFVKKRTRIIVMALLLAMTAASVLVFANTSRIPTQGSTTIVPNRLVISWDEDTREPVTIETFRFFGFNVAQLRTMVSALDGTISTNVDGTFQLMPSGNSVSFSPVTFSVETEIDYIVNQTSIRNYAGTLVSPSQPGWVFLTRYEYNWASVRDVIEALNLTLVDVSDDPDTGITEVTVARPLPADQQQPPSERPPVGPAAPAPDTRGGLWSPPWPTTSPGALVTPTPWVPLPTNPIGMPTPTPGLGTPMPSPDIGTPMPTPPMTGFGSISGRVFDVDTPVRQGISQASVSLHTSVNSPPLEDLRTTTSALGVYTIDNIPAGRYYVLIEAEDFVPEFIPIQVHPGITNYVQTLHAYRVDDDRTATVSGSIFHGQSILGVARDNLITDPVTLEFREGFTSHGRLVETITVRGGNYELTLPFGNYHVTARADGYHTKEVFVSSYATSETTTIHSNKHISLSPVNAPSEAFRIELIFCHSFGHTPYQPHLRGPLPNGGRMHVAPFLNRSVSVGGRRLAYINTAGSGVMMPGGIIRIDEFINGRYDYYVRYMNSHRTEFTGFQTTNATVRVFDENNQLLRTFHVPTTTGPNVLWHVFSIEVIDGVRTIVPVNNMYNGPIQLNTIGD